MFSNRALGILSAFVRNNSQVRTWLLPANVCFCVPLLFISQERKVLFYDFGLGVDPVEAALAKSAKGIVGILLVNHYGIRWHEDAVAFIKQIASPVILDACLSPPEFDSGVTINADLTLYSTGIGKVVELGYGAFGHLTNPINNRFIFDARRCAHAPAYDSLDRHWKQVLTGGRFEKERVLDGVWIDEGNELVADPAMYTMMVKDKCRDSLRHKIEINKIYNSIIDEDFQWHRDGNLWRFNILVNDKKLLLNEIFSQMLFASHHYANASKYLGNNRSLPHADIVANHMVNLFNSPGITADFAERCASTVQRLIRDGKLKPIKLSSQ